MVESKYGLMVFRIEIKWDRECSYWMWKWTNNKPSSPSHLLVGNGQIINQAG